MEKVKETKVGIRRIPNTVIVLAWFAGTLTVSIFMFRSFMTIDAAFHIFFLSGLGFGLIHALFEPEKNNKILGELAFYSWLGVAPIICALIISINFYVRGETYAEYYRIEKFEPDHNPTGSRGDIYLENMAYDKFDYVIDYDQWELYKLTSSEYIKLNVADGLFGYKVLLSAQLVDEK